MREEIFLWLTCGLYVALAGEHTHTIVGYSLIKGIGDGEPIASERFTVGGHEWVRLRLESGPVEVGTLMW